jgi:hypothetical protein
VDASHLPRSAEEAASDRRPDPLEGVRDAQDIEFDAEAVTLRGWLYLSDGATGPAPTVVMAHGFSAASSLPTPDPREWFSETGRTRAPSWRVRR